MPRIAVIGVGLIGGSIGKTARERGLGEVVGWVRDPARSEACLESGALDEVAPTLEEAVADAEIAFSCVSVGALPEVTGRILAAVGDDTVVTDVGSTKGEMVERFGDDPRFIGGHPLAGAETAGVKSARADLFDGARWLLTPTEVSSGILYDRLNRFITSIGARPAAIDAAEHDAAIAVASHLPHVFANQLAGQALAGSERLGAVAPSLRDATRVAGSNPTVWSEILASNADPVSEAIGAAIAGLERSREVIATGDPEVIREWQEEAASARAALSAVEGAGEATHAIRILVPNRPGVLAQVALALGEDGVNIVDMSLEPASDMSSGAITVWVAGEADVGRASRSIEDLGFQVSPAEDEVR